ncbi:unnamed protein product [Brassica rapa subsp. trilocularis]
MGLMLRRLLGGLSLSSLVVRRSLGFTKFNRADYTRMRQSKRIVPDGVNAKFLSNHGPLAKRQPGSAFISATE